MQYYGNDWLATVCGLTGVYLLGNKSKIGFVLFMMASTHHEVGALAGRQRAAVGQTERPGCVHGDAAPSFFGREAEQRAGHVQHQQQAEGR